IFQEVIPFLSAIQNGSLISQIEDVKEIDNELCYITSAFGGKTQLYLKPLKTPVFITLKNFNYDSLKDEQNSIKIENREISEIKTNIEILEYIKQEKHLKLEEAKIIVSGGRGLGNKEGFELIKELADLLGGAVGASRAAVDSGWIDPHHQIGQTGKTVSPDLYIAVGISGASQHIMGMNKSKFIVSINTDPEAPIFKYSHLGIIEDYKEFLPALIRILKENKS
ncbi:MAG: electron transfer flavoprotein subunit alpha/FixB family protein, partial [bacterium]